MGMTRMSGWRAVLAVPCVAALLLAAGCKEVQDIREELGLAKQKEAPPPAPVVSLADRWIPADSAVGDLSQAQWTQRWWQWVGRFAEVNDVPYRDPDGRRCALHQEDGPVWFLAGTDGNFDAVRNCRIPSDKHLFVPLINWVVVRGLQEQPMTCEEKQAEAARLAENVNNGLVLLDGRPLGELARMRVAAGGCFAMGEEAPAVTTDGYWLMLKPLPPGKHQLAINAAWRDGPRQLLQNFRYELEVDGPGGNEADDAFAEPAEEAAATIQ